MFEPKACLLGGAILAALSATAFAADIPARGPVYAKAPAAAWSWEGQYIGVHGGYFDGNNDLFAGTPFPLQPRGGFGGLQFGHLHHLSRNWVVGYEIDVSFASLEDTFTITTGRIDLFGTARTRIGYAQGPWLLYGTAGLAWSQLEIVSGPTSLERDQVGYAVGVGVEYAFAPRWSAKLEYLYLDLGETSTGFVPDTNELTASIIRLGLNYRFANWRAAVAPDVPVKAPVRATGWTGPYIGIHGGYAWGDFEVIGSFVGSGTSEPKGGFFGIQSGYNWQLSQNWVIGIEADSSWGSIEQASATATADIDAMGTVRGRLGYADGNRLYYITGGLAWLHADTSSAVLITRDQFWLGWTAGVGVEYALSQKWSAKIEYRYSSFESEDTIPVGVLRNEFDIHAIKLGLNYRAGILDLLGVNWQ